VSVFDTLTEYTCIFLASTAWVASPIYIFMSWDACGVLIAVQLQQ